MVFGRSDSASQAHVSPDYVRARVSLEECDYLFEIGRLGFTFCNLLCKRKVDVVVKNDDKACFGGEIENAIEGWIFEAGDFTGNLCGDEFFVNCKFADT